MKTKENFSSHNNPSHSDADLYVVLRLAKNIIINPLRKEH